MRWRGRMIPIHTPCLGAAGTLTWLGSLLAPWRRQGPALEAIWGPLLPRRRLTPSPTGRHALWYFLGLAGLQPGDEVLVSAYNYYVVVQVIVQRGLVPVFVDVEAETLAMDPDDLRAKISPRSRLVVVTHLFGNAADLERIVPICRDAGLLLFEDCAHAVGTRHGGEQVGQAGEGALFSFALTKIVSSFSGGMLALDERWSAGYTPPPHRVSAWHSFGDTFFRVLYAAGTSPALYGWILYPLEAAGERRAARGKPWLKELLSSSRDTPHYRFEVDSRAPFKPFMPRLHARQLAGLEAQVARRRAIVRAVKDRLRALPGVGLLDEDKHGRANCSYFGIYVADHRALAGHLASRGIEADPQPYRDCSALEQFRPWRAHCERAAYAAAHLLRLPSYPLLRDGEVERLGAAVAELVAGSPAPAATLRPRTP